MSLELDVLREKMLDYRARHNISQVRFAELCQLTPQTVCNIENGIQEPSKLTKQKILNLIGKEN
jgi:DNA-binding XRE family transcriptional regulator